MASRISPYVDNTGLVFAYDLANVKRSYLGEPTTNFAYLHNGRKDSSYESYMPESGTGQIAALHPGAIRVYNQNGSDISYYLNTGINISNSGVNWYDTNHAYWVYDDVLKKPVVQMIDRNGVWQAKYMGLGVNWADLGLTNGDQYTISWLQWSSDGVKRAHAGVYWYDTTAGYSNFWDGLSDTGTSTPGKWTRVSQTFTLSAGRSLDQGLTWYMYGMYYSTPAILRIADVQLEKKSHTTPFTFSYNRSATQGLKDLTGNSTIDLTNVSFDSNAQMTFDGTNDLITLADAAHLKFSDGSFTVEQVLNISSISGKQRTFSKGSSGWSRGWHAAARPTQWEFELSDGVSTPGNSFLINTATTVGTNHVVWVIESAATAKLYVNGVQVGSTQTITEGVDFATTTSTVGIGAFESGGEYFNGRIPYTRLYARALSASEIQQNFNAIKGRYGL